VLRLSLCSVGLEGEDFNDTVVILKYSSVKIVSAALEAVAVAAVAFAL
jgi:hypothetical protein